MLDKKIINISLFIILIIAIFLDINYFPNIYSAKENLKFLLLIPHTAIVFCIFLLLGLNAEKFDKESERIIWLGLKKSSGTSIKRINFFRYLGYIGSIITGLGIVILIILWYVNSFL